MPKGKYKRSKEGEMRRIEGIRKRFLGKTYEEIYDIEKAREKNRKMVETRRKNNSYVAWNKGKRLSKNHKKNLSKNHRTKRGYVPWNKRKRVSPKERRRLKKIGFQKGYTPWNKGKPFPQASKRMKESNPTKNPEVVEKIRKSMKKQYLEGERISPFKELWENPDSKEKLLKKILKGLMKHPTGLEMKFIKIIKKYNLPYKYVGDGSSLIGFKNPDFINIDGEKICIEVRSRDVCEIFHHIKPEEYAEKRIKFFDKWGWKCLILFGKRDKLDDSEEVILEKIQAFCT